MLFKAPERNFLKRVETIGSLCLSRVLKTLAHSKILNEYFRFLNIGAKEPNVFMNEPRVCSDGDGVLLHEEFKGAESLRASCNFKLSKI